MSLMRGWAYKYNVSNQNLSCQPLKIILFDLPSH
jgi:hypothetical protein